MNDQSISVIGLTGSDGHLTPMALNALRSGGLCEEALTAALEHIGGCERCADAYASGYDTGGLAQVPAGFGEELQKKLNTKLQNKHEFAFYVLRVVIAACVALIITFSSAFNALVSQTDKISGVKAPSFDIVNKISSQLRDFSQNIVNMEGFYNASKKE